MAKAVRPDKVFVDWSQNARFKTTIGAYSMRARLEPTVSHVHVDTGRLSAAMAWFERSAALSRSVGERFGVR